MIYRDIQSFMKKALNRKKQIFIKSNFCKYVRVCCGFDIETTRIDKYAYMYHWQLSWNDDILLLRYWADFEILVEHINKWLEPKHAKLIVWVANLGHEFAFLGRRFQWKHIFARESHQPITATTGNIEFRECLTISGQGGLANLAKNYCTTHKMLNDLNYSVIRNGKTPLSEKEETYCINDVKILSEWADYIFKEYSDKGQNIPLTSTSIVRNDIKQAAENTGHINDIRQAVLSLYPTREFYNFAMSYLFRGGYTHANIWYVCVPWENTIGVDFTSSYPAVMLQEYYPMTPFAEFVCEHTEKEITDISLQTHCCIFYINIYNIEQTTYHSIESQHKIIKMENAIFDNGRLRSADKIQVIITELDYDTYTKFYKWEKIEILKATRAERGKLPNYVLKPLMKYYETKQNLKKQGLDHTNEYKNAKARLNSFYGCMVTRLVFMEQKYAQEDIEKPDGTIINAGEWYQIESNKTYAKMIEKQLLSPYWGIWVTAHARHRLLDTVFEMDKTTENEEFGFLEYNNNVLYCDTDSIYFDDTLRNREIIAKYNEKMAQYNKENLPPVFADIGLFDWVDKDKNKNPIKYEFETLGAKRYLKYYDNHAEITVAGMRKGTYERKIMHPFATDNSYPIFETYENENGEKCKRRLGYVDKKELFEMFTDNFLLVCDESNKLCSAYSYDEYEQEVTDEHGNTEIMQEKCGVALVPIPFNLRLEEQFILLLEQIMNERRLLCRK